MEEAREQTQQGAVKAEDKEDCQDLINERDSLDPSYENALRLLNSEIEKKKSGVATGMIDVCSDKQIRLEVKVRIPQKEHPKFNFVGKLLGPNGNSMRRMHEETQTRMAILGRGSMKDKKKEEDLRKEGLAKNAHLKEELHVSIEVFAAPTDAYQRLAHAITDVHKYMVPDPNDGIRQGQLRELAQLRGTFVEGPQGPPRGGMRGGMRGHPRGGRGGGFAPHLPLRGGHHRGGMGGPMGGPPGPPGPGPMSRGGHSPIPPPPGPFGEPAPHPRGMAVPPAPRGGGFGGPNRGVISRGGGGPPSRGGMGSGGAAPFGGGGHQEPYYDEPRTGPAGGGGAFGGSGGYGGSGYGSSGGYGDSGDTGYSSAPQDGSSGSGFYGSNAGFGNASDREYRGNGFQDSQSYGNNRDSGWAGAGGRTKAPGSFQEQKGSFRSHPYNRY